MKNYDDENKLKECMQSERIKKHKGKVVFLMMTRA